MAEVYLMRLQPHPNRAGPQGRLDQALNPLHAVGPDQTNGRAEFLLSGEHLRGIESVRGSLRSLSIIKYIASKEASIHDAVVHAKANDATAKLVHHNQNPVGAQRCRFAPE